ncbi:MAG: glycosyltransferase family 39 protein [Gemmatimonadaceae bacterium]|nr:glycosyltransferase family 39 protein [Gemmatimonadaceae bacterium]
MNPDVDSAANPDRAAQGRSVVVAWVVMITLVALALRLINLTSDLWLDEISPVVEYAQKSVPQVISTYRGSNNHLLNTLLVKLSISVFGEHEWSVRLPALIFGIATVPVLYWVARFAMTTAASLGAAFLLAISYHHIFFSQNARGYTAYLFFALVSTGLLVQSVRETGPSRWRALVASMFLGFASLLNTAFVYVSHFAVGVVSLLPSSHGNTLRDRRIGRLLAAFIAAGLAAAILYAGAASQAVDSIGRDYRRAGSGFSLLSVEFFLEIVRGVSAGFGAIGLALLFLAAAALGYWTLLRSNWQIAVSLALPLALTAALLVALNLSFSPRFFLLGVPLAMLSAMSLVDTIAAMVQRRRWLPARLTGWVIGGAAIAMSLASAASLPAYYDRPKQPYRAAVRYLENLRLAGEPIAVIYVAESGFRYYTGREAVRDNGAYTYLRTKASFDSLAVLPRSGNLYVVTTLPRGLQLALPELWNTIVSRSERIRVFSGTIGDGDITIWRLRPR